MLLLATPRKRLRAAGQPSLDLAVPKGARAAGAALVMPRAVLNTVSHSALLLCARRGAGRQKVLRTESSACLVIAAYFPWEDNRAEEPAPWPTGSESIGRIESDMHVSS